jgi:DMSO/TMAO reductase YedYZ molybdopterin-dependent catalytic subunit
MNRPDLVGKRLAYIARHKQLHADAVNVDVSGRAPEGSGPANRDGMPNLPVGQHVVSNWPQVEDVSATEDDVLLVHTWEGRPLPREHGGPVRVITPKLYAWKGTKWVRRIEFLPRDQRGFWEQRGYSNTAEPWFNDRYS